ncbi:MAG: GNAT family N-acetyltransferase [Opitutaceae bacterium]
MRASLEHVGRFEPTRARDRLQKSFFPEHSQFILLDGNKVGFYTFRRTDDGFRLDHLYIHPSHQSQGVGSLVLQTLIAQADAQRQPVHVGALKESAANHFYARHGFHPQAQDAWDIHYIRPAVS